MFNCLIVPLDGSELAERALPYAVQLAKVGGGRVVLYHEAPVPISSDIIDVRRYRADTRAQAEHYLSSVAHRISPIVRVDIVATFGQAPAEGILNTAKQHTADAVVMATHGRSGLPHLLYGSVAEAVWPQVTCPSF